jgi:hypothetical protein
MVNGPEVKNWRKFAREWQRHHDVQMGRYVESEYGLSRTRGKFRRAS